MFTVQVAEESLKAMEARSDAESKAAAEMHAQQSKLMSQKIAQLQQEVQGLRASTKMLEMQQMALEREKQVCGAAGNLSQPNNVDLTLGWVYQNQPHLFALAGTPD